MLESVIIQQSTMLGKLVLAKKWVNLADLKLALSHQEKHSCLLGESLVSLGYIDQFQLATTLAEQESLRTYV